MIKHVLLDLDQTIYDFHRAESVALSEVLVHFGIEPTVGTVALYSEINDRHWKALERGEITREMVLTHRFSELFDTLGVEADAMEARQLYERRLGECAFFIDGASELLEALAPEYSLYLASNGTDSVQTRRIARGGIEKYFKGIFISQRIGYDKPSVRYFEECFKKIDGFKKEEAVIVGDSLSSDILGGKNAGIATVWYNPCHKKAGDVKPDYEISELSELIPLLKKM